MNKDDFLIWLPEQERQRLLKSYSGFTAIKLPAGYFPRVPQSQNINWINLTQMVDGRIVKVAPDDLIKGAIKTMEKYNQEFETYVI